MSSLMGIGRVHQEVRHKMEYLFVPKDILAEKLSNLENAVNEMERIAKQGGPDSVAKPFYELLFIHYKDLKELQNYTLAPPHIRISERTET